MVMEGEHECARFEVQGIPCPFRPEEPDEEEDDDDVEERPGIEIPLALPGRQSKNQRGRMGQLNNILTLAHSQEEMREKLKVIEGERIAAIVPGGESLIQELLRTGQQFGGNRLFQVGTLIALATALAKLRGKGLGLGLGTARALERPVARGLGRLATGSGLTTAPGGPGRGGFHVNAAAELQSLFGGRSRRRFEEKMTGQGFFFPGEPQ